MPASEASRLAFGSALAFTLKGAALPDQCVSEAQRLLCRVRVLQKCDWGGPLGDTVSVTMLNAGLD